MDAIGMATVVDTELGPVEYVELGAGSPVLFVHGSPGGWDEGELLSRFLVDAGFRVIAPSRPGYLGTPLTDANATPDGQGRLHLALMDALGIDLFSAACWSGGGPSSYRLAALGGERVQALVAIAAISGSGFDPRFEGHILERRFGKWIVAELRRQATKPLIEATLAEESSFDRRDLKAVVEEVWSDDDKRTFVLELAEIIASRRPGLLNDLEQFPKIVDLDLPSIVAPVLLVHGTLDADVPPVHRDRAAAALNDVERHDIDGGSHIAAWTGPGEQEAQDRIVTFLRTHSP